MEHLWSPWRMAYLRGDDSPAATDRLPATGMLSSPGCIFCDKPRESRDRENLIVHRAERAFVILNLYPYNNGHLMVVPYQHVPSFEQLDEPALAEVMRLLNQGVAAL